MTARTEGPSAAVKLRVFKRDRFRCTYCGAPGTDAELEAYHIIAVSKGGSHHISNLTTACRACNQQKGNRDAPSAVAKVLSHTSCVNFISAWTPHTANVRLFRLPAPYIPREYRCTGLGAYAVYRTVGAEQRKLLVFLEAYHMIVADGCDPDAVHRAFWPLDEYRNGLASDFPPPGAGHRWRSVPDHHQVVQT